LGGRELLWDQAEEGQLHNARAQYGAWFGSLKPWRRPVKRVIAREHWAGAGTKFFVLGDPLGSITGGFKTRVHGHTVSVRWWGRFTDDCQAATFAGRAGG
jgi:hypothetical protein